MTTAKKEKAPITIPNNASFVRSTILGGAGGG